MKPLQVVVVFTVGFSLGSLLWIPRVDSAQAQTETCITGFHAANDSAATYKKLYASYKQIYEDTQKNFDECMDILNARNK